MARSRSSTEATIPRFTIQTVPAARQIRSLAEDVREGFALTPKQLPPKYFYDDRGSALFDRICDTPEYYPMRTEAALLEEHTAAIVAATQPEHIVELGSGTSRKTDALLGACERAGIAPVYWPYDVCEGVLQETGERLLARFPWLQVNALVGDYTAGLDYLPRPGGRCLYVFLGGTLGNFEPDPAAVLLADLTRHMGADDGLLLGTDRVKPRATLEAAYNDAAGVSAEFNRNVLHVINRELEADFEPDVFRHEAVFNAAASRMEMRLYAERAQTVTIGALERSYHFAEGEALFTEISRKFTADSLRDELTGEGLALEREWVAPGDFFSLSLSRSAGR